MAYDGIVISSVINEIKTACLGGRVVKVQQPGADIIALTVKGFSGQTKIYISVNASLPIVYVADTLPPAPVQAPAFCMLLRKHIGNGRLTDVRQPGFDRVFDFVFEHLDEMGDMCERHLIVEIMGRQSNIILTDAEYVIMDCLRRVMPDLSEAVSENSDKSIRIMFPGQKYSAPDSQGKVDIMSQTDSITKQETRKDTEINTEINTGIDTGINTEIKTKTENGIDIEKIFEGKTGPVPKLIYTSFAGFSKGIAEDMAEAAGIDSRAGYADISTEEREKLSSVISFVTDSVREGKYTPFIKYLDGVPKDFHAIKPKNAFMDGNRTFTGNDTDSVSEENQHREQNQPNQHNLIEGNDLSEISMSHVLIDFYSNKERTINIRSRSEDIRKVLKTLIERTTRKYDMQRQQLADTEDRDIYRVYGELLNTYGYSLKGGEDSLTCTNYYDNKEITIPLDTNLTASENSQKYFAKYNKKKRTYEALTDFVAKTKEDLDYLLSARHSLDMAQSEADINELREELVMSGFIKKSGKKKERKKQAGEPLHFVSSDGYDIYVGKNNIQNEYLSFELATGKDLWFHAKQMPGSHVIVKLKPEDTGLDSVPDRVFEEAASLAAYYSSGGDAPKVEIDYTQRKNLKKPPQAKPGYVIYHTNYSMMAEPRKLI